MPTISTTKSGKNAGKRYLNYDLDELSSSARKAYDAQAAAYETASKLREAFITSFRNDHKDIPAGAAILCSFGKIAVPEEVREKTVKGTVATAASFFAKA